MAEKNNKEALGLVDIEDVMDLYEQLTPWDQAEFSDMFGTDFSSFSEEDILKHFGIDPIDHVDEKEVYDTFGDVLLDKFCDFEIYDEFERRLWNYEPHEIIYLLHGKLEENVNPKYTFTEDDVESLEKIITLIKEKLNNEVKK